MTASVNPNRNTPPRISSSTIGDGDGLALERVGSERVLDQVHRGVRRWTA